MTRQELRNKWIEEQAKAKALWDAGNKGKEFVAQSRLAHQAMYDFQVVDTDSGDELGKVIEAKQRNAIYY